MKQLEHLDEIAREAFAGNYRRTGVLSRGERLYVALASGRMRELCPSDSIAYAVDRVGPEWMEHMLQVWRGDSQPTAAAQEVELVEDAAESAGPIWNALLDYVLENKNEDPLVLLRLWREGSFDEIRKEWPDVPEAIFPKAN